MTTTHLAAESDGTAPLLISMAEHARRCRVSRKSVTVWRREGKLKMSGDLVNFWDSYKGEDWHNSLKGILHRGSTNPPPIHRRSAPLTLSRAEWLARLQALDWTVTPDWAEQAQRQRVIAAAAAVGLVAVEDEARDGISRHGGWQLRAAELLTRHGGPCTDAVAAGFGFELDNHDALAECRLAIAYPDDGASDLAEPMTLDPAALALLAHPLSACHQRATT